MLKNNVLFCQIFTKVKLNAYSQPEEAVRLLLSMRTNKLGESQANHYDYVLKVCGLDEFLYGPYPLIQFKVGTCFQFVWLSWKIVWLYNNQSFSSSLLVTSYFTDYSVMGVRGWGEGGIKRQQEQKISLFYFCCWNPWLTFKKCDSVWPLPKKEDCKIRLVLKHMVFL